MAKCCIIMTEERSRDELQSTRERKKNPSRAWLFLCVSVVCCKYRPLRWADHSSRGAVPSVRVPLCVREQMQH
jgi:hypothetical protein